MRRFLAGRWGPVVFVVVESAALILILPRVVHDVVSYVVIFWGFATVCYFGNYRLWLRLQRPSGH